MREGSFVEGGEVEREAYRGKVWLEGEIAAMKVLRGEKGEWEAQRVELTTAHDQLARRVKSKEL